MLEIEAHATIITYYSATCETICEVNQYACHIAKHFFFPWFTCTLGIVSISNRYLCGIAIYFSYRLNCMMKNIFWLISNVQNPNGSHSINSYGAISGAAQNKRQIRGIWGSFSVSFKYWNFSPVLLHLWSLEPGECRHHPCMPGCP